MNSFLEIHQQISKLAEKYQLRRGSELSYPGLSVSQAYALGFLVKDGPQRMSDLATRLHVTLGAVNKIVAELESKGFVLKRPSEKDRRSIMVSATKAGQKFYREIQKRFKNHLTKELSGIPPEQVELLGEGLKQINLAIESWREKLVTQ